MSYSFSKSLEHIRPSASMAKGLGGTPVKFNLAIGSPDVPLPSGMDRLLEQFKQQPTLEYLPTQGTLKARKSLLNNLIKPTNPAVSEDNLVLCSGAKYGIYLSLKTITNPGDTVMLLQPYWLSYPDICSSLYLNFQSFPFDFHSNSYNLLLLKEQLLQTKAKVLMINNPNNPSGVVLSKAFLADLCEFCQLHSIWIVMDEVYKDLVFPNVEIDHDFLGLDGIIRVGSVSKSLAMPGLRLGYVLGHPDFVKKFVLINQHISTCINAFSSFVAENLQELNLDSFIQANKILYQKRFLKAQQVLNSLGYQVIPSSSTFYLFCQIPSSKFSSISDAENYFDSIGIRLTTGGHYGSQFNNYLRICLTFDDSLWSELEPYFRK